MSQSEILLPQNLHSEKQELEMSQPGTKTMQEKDENIQSIEKMHLEKLCHDTKEDIDLVKELILGDLDEKRNPVPNSDKEEENNQSLNCDENSQSEAKVQPGLGNWNSSNEEDFLNHEIQETPMKKSDGDPKNITNENSHVAKDVVNKEETTEDEAKAGQLPEDIQQKSLLQNFEEQESDMLNQDLAETLQLDKQEVLQDDANFNSDKSIGKFYKLVNKLELSTNSLSYERFFAGRVLGNTFVAKNNSSELIKLAISFDNSKINNHYVADKLCEHYSCDSVNEMEDPYSKHMLQEVDTTKEVLDVWHLEDPYTKKLSQFVEFELEPNSEQEFIIVLKSPANNQQIMYVVDVVLHQIENGFKDSVFCFGFLEQLKISIPKEMYNTKLNARIVKIVLQRKQKAQSIKLLLENKGDMSVITNFQSIELEENLQFCLPKNKLSLEPKSKALLEIKALYKPINQPRQQNTKPEVIHKLVISKVKDCELKFSIVFEITIL